MIKLYKYLSLIILTAFFFIGGCADDANPGLGDLITPSTTPPVISSISPVDDVLGGVTVLTITGTNLPMMNDGNSSVSFDGIKGTIIETSESQMKVVPPIIASDSIEVKVQKFKVENFSNTVIQKILPAAEEYYPFDANNNEFPFAITMDDQENLYVILNGQGTKKIDTQGNMTDFAPGNTAAPFFRSMTIASDNAIYGAKGGVKGIYRVVEGTGPAAFVASSQGIADNINSVSFDKTRNVIWAGGNTGFVHRVTLDKNVKKFNVSGRINALKVLNNALFIASTFENKELVWRMPIVTADSLGTPELYFDFSTSIDTTLDIIDLMGSEDGDIYLGTSDLTDPIYVVHPDKSFAVFYPGIIGSTPYSMVWGNGPFAYFSNVVDLTNKTVLRLRMQKNGAY